MPDNENYLKKSRVEVHWQSVDWLSKAAIRENTVNGSKVRIAAIQSKCSERQLRAHSASFCAAAKVRFSRKQKNTRGDNGPKLPSISIIFAATQLLRNGFLSDLQKPGHQS
jgi:hypothetical protein